jgi:hypothetical protein
MGCPGLWEPPLEVASTYLPGATHDGNSGKYARLLLILFQNRPMPGFWLAFDCRCWYENTTNTDLDHPRRTHAKYTSIGILSLLTLFAAGAAFGDTAPVSDATQECLDCHAVFHPGIVADWQKSRHARVTPKTAMAVEELQRRMSSRNVPEALQETSVGCAECHTLRGEAHADTFEHNGYDIHVVVSPDDCATCHATEREQYSKNIMAMAEKNLSENTVYADLQRNILGRRKLSRIGSTFHRPTT